MMLAALITGLLMSWPDAEAARQAAEQITAAEKLQRQLPAPQVKAPPKPFEMPPPTRSSGERRSATPPSGAGHGLGEIVLWVLGGLLLAGFIAVLLKERFDRPVDSAEARDAPAEPVPTLDRAVIGDAERLAAAGRFAEAVHALLLRTIEALSRHEPVPQALTSREVLSRVGLPTAARAAFADLVTAVEVTRFGGRPADADDYARCVGCFDRIRDALARA